MKQYYVLILAALLTACGDSDEIPKQEQYYPQQQPIQQPVYQQPQQPVIINQAPVAQDDDTVSDMLVGGLVGAAAANAFGGGNSGYNQYSNQSQHTRTIVRERIIQQPAPKKWGYRPTQVKAKAPQTRVISRSSKSSYSRRR